VADDPEERFEETLDLEWPIEGLQPLSFVLGRLFDALSAHLAARGRAAAVLHVHLQLVTRVVERRSLQLPAPMRDARVLRTLVLLNLEAHPVSAGVDRVTVIADPVPGRVIQHSLLTRGLPLPEQLSTLLARLAAVMGEGRCGMAALVDSYRPGAFEMKAFPVEDRTSDSSRAHGMTGRQSDRLTFGPSDDRLVRPRTFGHSRGAPLVIRRFRIPVPAFVAVKDGRPVRVTMNRLPWAGGPGCLPSGGCVQACAGPWRTSGEWWHVADARVQADAERPRACLGWNRDEWDVSLADGGVYRIYRDRDRDRWFVDGVID
jgi:protein ImuB